MFIKMGGNGTHFEQISYPQNLWITLLIITENSPVSQINRLPSQLVTF